MNFIINIMFFALAFLQIPQTKSQMDIVHFVDIENATATFDAGLTRNYVIWNEKGGMVFFDDYGVKLKKCDSSDLILCVREPFPIFLPRNYKKNYTYQGVEAVYLVDTFVQMRDVLEENNCYNERIWVRVKNLENKDVFWYLIAKKIGLLQILKFSDNDQNHSIPVANYTLSKGKVLAYDEACSE
jgi:hypothetical protein